MRDVKDMPANSMTVTRIHSTINYKSSVYSNIPRDVYGAQYQDVP